MRPVDKSSRHGWIMLLCCLGSWLVPWGIDYQDKEDERMGGGRGIATCKRNQPQGTLTWGVHPAPPTRLLYPTLPTTHATTNIYSRVMNILEKTAVTGQRNELVQSFTCYASRYSSTDD